MRLEPHPDRELENEPRLWWACAYPERPPDGYACWAVAKVPAPDDCPACAVALQAFVLNQPDRPIVHHDPTSAQPIEQHRAGDLGNVLTRFMP